MAASVGNSLSSIPEWKRSLIRRQKCQSENAEKASDTRHDDISKIPPWKQEILRKKKQKQVFRRPPSSGETSATSSNLHHECNVEKLNCDGQNENNSFHTEEHIIPIWQNPIWQYDVKKRRGIGSHGGRQIDSKASITEVTGDSIADTSEKDHCRFDVEATRHLEKNELACEDESEIVYGQGFVSKLLNRFQWLSNGKQDETCHRRSFSSDNLLDDSDNSTVCKITANNMSASHSLDDLLLTATDGGTETYISDTGSKCRSFVENMDDELPKPNTVMTARLVFESIDRAAKVSPKVKSACPLIQSTNSRDTKQTETFPVGAFHSSKSLMNAVHSNDDHCKRNGFANSAVNSRMSPGCSGNLSSDKSKAVAGRENPKRKNLNLNLTDIPPANSRKANKISGIVSDSAFHTENSVLQYLHCNSNSAGTGHLLTDQQNSFDDYNRNKVFQSFECNGTPGDDGETDDVPREGDPSEFVWNPSKRYEFEGAGVVIDRSLLAKSKNTKQMMISFNEAATLTHEYPSEQSLLEMNDTVHHEYILDNTNDDSYYDKSLSSYKLMEHSYGSDVYENNSSSSLSSADNSSSTNVNNNFILKPTDSESASSWSNSATADLLF